MSENSQQLTNSSIASKDQHKFDVLLEQPNSVKLTHSSSYPKELCKFPPGTILKGLSDKDGRILVVVDITNLIEKACLDHKI